MYMYMYTMSCIRMYCTSTNMYSMYMNMTTKQYNATDKPVWYMHI